MPFDHNLLFSKSKHEENLLDRQLSVEKPIQLEDACAVATSPEHEIKNLFLSSEAWAKDDWVAIYKKLTPHEIGSLSADHIVRVIRSSSYLAQPERRKRRNLMFLRKRVKWQEKFKVQEISKLCYGGSFSSKFLKGTISPTRIELFRSLVLPLKIYGKSKTGIPLVKFNLNEANWKAAGKIFKDTFEIRLLLVLTFESLIRELRKMKCYASCADEDTKITGKYILICNVKGFGVKHIKYGFRLSIHEIARLIWRYNPDTVLKTYVISNYSSKGSKILFPFVSGRIIKRVKFVASEGDAVQLLRDEDEFEIGQIPVEFGGNFEGRYVVSVKKD